MTHNHDEVVILLHGILRRAVSMRYLGKHLQRAGYDIINIPYPSTPFPIETLAETYIPEALAQSQTKSKVHFVGHSMGAIIVRYYLEKHSVENLGRVVMLAPPNHGSEVSDMLMRNPLLSGLYRKMFGVAGQQLGTDGICRQLKKVNYPLGVIAGDRSADPIFWYLLPKPNDGRVTVESTKVVGMKDHIVLNATHSFMVYNQDVIAQTLLFLQQERFILPNHGEPL